MPDNGLVKTKQNKKKPAGYSDTHRRKKDNDKLDLRPHDTEKTKQGTRSQLFFNFFFFIVEQHRFGLADLDILADA